MHKQADNLERHRGTIRQFMHVFFGITLAISLAVAAHKPEEEDGPASQLSQAPASARAVVNPLSGQAEAARAGHKLFHKNCVECHGSDARGRGHAADLRSPVIQIAPPGVLFWAIQNGRPRKGMPSWSKLSEQQLWQIVTYIKTLEQPDSGHKTGVGGGEVNE